MNLFTISNAVLVAVWD